MMKNTGILLFISCYLLSGCITQQPTDEIANLLANQRAADCKEDEKRINFCIRNGVAQTLRTVRLNLQRTTALALSPTRRVAVLPRYRLQMTKPTGTEYIDEDSFSYFLQRLYN